MSIFGENLRKAREQAGISQEAMADRLGMQRTNYVKVETKGRAGDTLIQRIAAIQELGVTYEQLKAWKRLEELDNQELLVLVREAFPDKSQRDAFIKEALQD